PEESESFEKILTDIDRVIVPGLVHWGHPLFMGYFGWTTTAPGILGEIITAPLNVNAMTWLTSPAATELETLVIDWLRQWLHLPEEFDGVVYDTASVGIMHALAVAREQAAPSTRKLGLAGRADLPRTENVATHRWRLRGRTRPFARMQMGDGGLERSGFDRGQSAQNAFCAARFQRALRARSRTTPPRLHARPRVSARGHGGSGEKLYGLRNPTWQKISCIKSLDGFSHIWPRGNGRAHSRSSPAG